MVPWGRPLPEEEQELQTAPLESWQAVPTHFLLEPLPLRQAQLAESCFAE